MGSLLIRIKYVLFIVTVVIIGAISEIYSSVTRDTLSYTDCVHMS